MADEIAVSLVATDAQFISSTLKAASAVEAITKQEERLAKTSENLGLDQRKFAQQFGKVERDRIAGEKNAERSKAIAQKNSAKEAARNAARDTKEKARAEKQAADATKKATGEQEAKQRQIARVLLGRKAVILGEASGIGTAAVAAVEMGSALVVAGVAAIALTVALATVAERAAEAKENSRGFLNILTKGRGTEALSDIDALATRLGVGLQDARDKFIQFRQAGLDNTQSARLEKLVADLNTVDRSGEAAKQAISRVLQYTSPGGRQTVEQVDASNRAMALLAKQAGVSGKGFESLAASTDTFAGAFNRIDNAKTRTLEKLGADIKPSIDSAAQSVANLVDNFLASDAGQEVIKDLTDGMKEFAKAVGDAADIASDALGDPEIQDDLKTIGGALKEVTADVGYLAAAFILAPVAAMQAFDTMASLAGEALLWGSNMVDGLVEGVEKAASRAYDAVGDFAGGIKDSFKRALGISSPAKAFIEYGDYSGRGYEIGAERSFPSGREMAQRMLPERAEIASAARGAAPGAAEAVGASSPPFGFGQPPIFGGGPTRSVQVTIQSLQINVPAGEDPDRWMRAAGRELGLGIQAILMTQGAPTDG